MNYRAVLNSLGRIFQVEGGLLLLPLITALIYRESPYPFLITAALLLLCGTLLTATMRGESRIYAREGFLIVALSWVFMSLFGALPFCLSKTIPSFINAFFETVSGFTTTGATVFTSVTGLPHGILFWRSFTHWIGGMGVLVFLTALLPKTNSRAVHIIRAETTGPVKGGKLVPKMRSTATILYMLYFGLTVLEIIMLICGGMSFFEAVTYSFATAGTGGFAISNAGLAVFNSTYIYITVSVFMLLFGVNFNLYYVMLMRDMKAFFKNEENRWYFAIVGASTLLIALNVIKIFGSFGRSLLMAFFNVSSIMTTTGFTVTDFNLWPTFSKLILVFLMLCGACAGSTGGAVKVSRIIIIFKTINRNVRKLLRPNQIEVVHLNGTPLPEEAVESTKSFTVLYFVILLASALFVSIDGYDLVTTVTAAISCLCNVGPGLGLVGPSGSFAIFSAPVKIVLSVDMLMGRLELFPIIMLFIPAAWRRR